MKKDLGPREGAFPEQVFVIATYNEDGVANAMNAAWGVQADYEHVAIYLGKHKTTDNIKARCAFTVAPADRSHVVEADYFGILSGAKTDKEKGSGLTFDRSAHVDAPVIREFPVTLECELDGIADFKGETLVTGHVVNVLADEEVLGQDGKVDFDLFRPLVFDPSHGSYRQVGPEVGKAWSVGKALTE